MDLTASLLALIAEHTSDVFVRGNRAGIVTHASPSIRAYGYQPSDIVGATGLQLIHSPTSRRPSPTGWRPYS